MYLFPSTKHVLYVPYWVFKKAPKSRHPNRYIIISDMVSLATNPYLPQRTINSIRSKHTLDFYFVKWTNVDGFICNDWNDPTRKHLKILFQKN
jgi:hypothetical protein